MVESVADFLKLILARRGDADHDIVYRGHGNRRYKLMPSVFRDVDRYKAEHILLRELVAAHPDEFSQDTSALEMLVRMQHYSLPTRLLDVSYNPLVALYFACEPQNDFSTQSVGMLTSRVATPADGEVVILSPKTSDIKYFDSDLISCLTNLSRLSFDHKTAIDTSNDKSKFNESLPIRRLLHFIRQEKVGFEADIEPAHLNGIYLVKPKQNNRRILAQAGAFFVSGLQFEIEQPSVARIERISIEATAKDRIRQELDRLGINEKTLFPDIERAARYLVGGIPASRLSPALPG